jgi:hypothetical protein
LFLIFANLHKNRPELATSPKKLIGPGLPSGNRATTKINRENWNYNTSQTYIYIFF